MSTNVKPISINLSVSEDTYTDRHLTKTGELKRFKVDPSFPYHKLYLWLYHDGTLGDDGDGDATKRHFNIWKATNGVWVSSVYQYGISARLEFLRDNRETLRLETQQGTYDSFNPTGVNMFPWTNNFAVNTDALAFTMDDMLWEGGYASVNMFPRLIAAECDTIRLYIDSITTQRYYYNDLGSSTKPSTFNKSAQIGSPDTKYRVFFKRLSSKIPF